MLKFIKNFFNTMDSEDEYDMLDLLAYNCTNLEEELNIASTDKQKLDIMREYLEKVDGVFQSIDDFKDDLDWFNVTEPLSLTGSLKGKIVILDFFTYCCINCMHILPDLKKLEEKFSVEDGLIVIGIHSAKFLNEKDSSNILSAVQRYDITHPVVNDNTSSMWMNLKIRCWPTLVILGPRGNPLFILMGEGHSETLIRYVTAALQFYKTKNEIKYHSLPLNPATDLLVSSKLKFPGKITCYYNENEKFAISDSGNNRILIVNHLGDVLQKIGGKKSGFIDGDFQTARFNSPQGVSFLNDHIIFVADTENHAIRKINLKTQKVETVAGTGKQGYDRIGGKIGKDQILSSPWDVVCHKTRDMDMSFHMDLNSVPEKDIILIAMAGTHQIWALFLDDTIWWKFKKIPINSCLAIVGNGHEENRNNSYPQNAAFAQPSGLAITKNPKQLFIADSESSCIRKVNLSDGKVTGVVGGDRNPLNLFAFGDTDGMQNNAKLQHPLGVAYHTNNNLVYVADTYNHKIKQISININSITTCKILDELTGQLKQFNEPGGLCLNSKCDQLYVADTNNHTIEIVDLANMTTKSFTLNFDTKETSKMINKDFSLSLAKLKIKPAGGKIKLSITLVLENLKLTENAPQTWIIYLPNSNYFVDKQNGKINIKDKIDLDITVPKNDSCNLNTAESIKLYMKINYCKNDLCSQKIYLLEIPLEFSDSGLDCIIEEVNCYLSDNARGFLMDVKFNTKSGLTKFHCILIGKKFKISLNTNFLQCEKH